MSLRLLMMGTGEFALPTFQALYETEHEVVGLVTQPDRTGRGHHRHMNTLKQLAEEKGTPVFQPAKVNTPDSLKALQGVQADLTVVAAYGQILSSDIINVSRLGTINLHASLLPKYRGAAPIQYALWNGETESGVSVFQIVPRLDAGPVFAMQATPIAPDETAGELHDRLAVLGAPVILQVVNQLEAGTATPIPQDDSLVSKSPQIKKEQGIVNWSQSADQIGWQVRAFQPWPKAFTFLPVEGKPAERITLKKVATEITPPKEITPPNNERTSSETFPPGTILDAIDGRLRVQTGEGVLEILTLQPAGKRVMQAKEFLNGRSLQGQVIFQDEAS